MKKQKVVITNEEHTIQEWLELGWTIISITPQHVSTNSSHLPGKFCFLLEKAVV